MTLSVRCLPLASFLDLPRSTDDLLAARDRIRGTLAPHWYFEQTKRSLLEALTVDDLVLLTGSSGVGKDSLGDHVVAELNERVAGDPRRLSAVKVDASTPRRGPFSFKRLWKDLLVELADPLVDSKVDRDRKLYELRAGLRTQADRASEDALRSAAFDALRDRHVEVVFINEALALLRGERGRTLRDQLDVLRELTDRSVCKIVLMATPRILGPLDLSGELARRMVEVPFRRYREADGRCPAETEAFRGVVKAFMDALPPAARPKLTSRRLVLLHAGSLGCVGHLSHWFERAIVRCAGAGASVLDFGHFEKTVHRDAKLKKMRVECEEGDRLLADLTRRTFGLAADSADASDTSAPATNSPAPSASDGPRSGKRVGMPAPARHKVA